MGKGIVITSGKGGTGKTLFAVNMAAVLALRGKKVVLVDMDMGLRNLDLYLGLESRVVYNVMDVFSGLCGIRRALVRDKRFPCLHLLSASPHRDQRDITPLHMEVLMEKLKEDFDYVLVDAPAGIDKGFDVAVTGSDQGIIITEPEIASLRDGDVVNGLLKAKGIRHRHWVINKVKGDLMDTGALPSIDEITSAIRGRVAGLIQYDDNILVAATRGIPIVMKPGTYIEKNFHNIVERILPNQ